MIGGHVVKRKLYIVFILISVIVSIRVGKVYGFRGTELNERICVADDITLEDDVLKVMKESFQYEEGINDPMKLKTTIRVKKRFFGKYDVYIGEENSSRTPQLKKRVSKKYLEENYGYQEEYGEDPWKAILIVSPITSDEELESTELEHNSYIFCINEIYTEEHYTEGNNKTIPKNKPSLLNITFNTKVEKAIEIVNSDILKRFAKNPFGFALTYILEGVRYLLGDSALTLAHAITFSNTKFVYSYDQLSTDEYGSIDKYTKVGKYAKGKKSKGQKEITIPLENAYEDEEYRRFSSTTKIPVVTIDLYNIAADNVEFFDINFFNVDEERHPDESPWTILRDFATGVIHVTIYMAAVILLLLLIVNGIQMVGHTLDNPQARADHIRILRRLAMSILMLVGTVVIMTLCTYGSNIFLNDVKVAENDKELPIRVNVEEAGYSFSTNMTGYFRYMTEIEGIHNYGEKAMYTLVYIIIAWVDLALALMMMARTIIMMMLAIEGPILAVLYSFNVQGMVRYRHWIRVYVSLAFLQVFFAIVYRVIFKFAM